eukprot:TRINITY_DN38334_c0_g1_i1.p1 TRINITY_DN38334_c0_g1~~TRINITY_DN38334_c0_g1_i1.p1  ORF type:complete len:465 (+),score=58.93 TRINITY_DN38334_c0_g1_i1:152-1546(+)
MKGRGTALSVAMIACVVGYVVSQPKVRIPEHMTRQSVVQKDNLLEEADARELMETMKAMKVLPSNANDLKFYETKNEHVGEAVPITEGGCRHPYMVPNINRTHCILAGRIDIGKHYMKTGGTEGLKEGYSSMVSRLQSFGAYNFDFEKYPAMVKVFEKDVFQTAAKAVCPEDSQVLDPFQFNFIVQVPGQTVATHIDGVYFWGASRFDVPQWLLAAMKFSGLFEDRFINQVQVVGYIHDWEDDRDGEFVYWNDVSKEVPDVLPPKRLSGSALDGSKIVHAATNYMKSAQAPYLDKSDVNTLEYVGGDDWEIVVNNATKYRYKTNDLRVSVVYRARCFKTAEEVHLYHNQPESLLLSLDDILGAFKTDLSKKGLLPSAPTPPLDLALLILDTYITYPLPPFAFFPINYCLVPRIYPKLAFVFVPLEILLFYIRSRRIVPLKVILATLHALVRIGFASYITLQMFC